MDTLSSSRSSFARLRLVLLNRLFGGDDSVFRRDDRRSSVPFNFGVFADTSSSLSDSSTRKTNQWLEMIEFHEIFQNFFMNFSICVHFTYFDFYVVYFCLLYSNCMPIFCPVSLLNSNILYQSVDHISNI